MFNYEIKSNLPSNGSSAGVSSGQIPPSTQNTPQADYNSQIAKTMYGSGLQQGIYTLDKDHSISLGEIAAPAVIMVIGTKNGDVKYITNKFFLSSIQKPKMERFQIIETFRDSKIFFFGERTKIYTISGSLIESNNGDLTAEDKTAISEAKQNNSKIAGTQAPSGADNLYRWSTGLQDFYNKYLRGTKLAEQDNIAILSVSGYLIHGYPIQLQVGQDSNNPNLVQFQMTWAIMKEENIDIVSSEVETTYRLGQSRTQDVVKYKKDIVELEKLRKEWKRLEAIYKKANAEYEELQSSRYKISGNTNLWNDTPEDSRNAIETKKQETDTAVANAYNKYLAKLTNMTQGN